ncbi:MAG: serine hydrolase, partial [Spirochaetaceae bacterium]|nr:serine hydrolase [Spirochaetaceae bacterium]
EALFNGIVLSEKSLGLGFTPAKLNDGSDASFRGANYGLGWFLYPNNKIEEISHGGGLPGFHTYLGRFPEEKVTIIILSNSMIIEEMSYITSSITSIILKKENSYND